MVHTGKGVGRYQRSSPKERIVIHHHHNYSHQCLITCTWRFVLASRKTLIMYHHYHLRLLSVFPSGTGGCSLTALLFTSIRHVKYLFPFR